MSVESFELPQDLVSAFKTMIATFAGIGNATNAASNDAFLAQISANQQLLMQFPNADDQMTKIMDQLTAAKTASRQRSVQDPEEEKKGPASNESSMRVVTD